MAKGKNARGGRQGGANGKGKQQGDASASQGGASASPSGTGVSPGGANGKGGQQGGTGASPSGKSQAAGGASGRGKQQGGASGKGAASQNTSTASSGASRSHSQGGTSGKGAASQNTSTASGGTSRSRTQGGANASSGGASGTGRAASASGTGQAASASGLAAARKRGGRHVALAVAAGITGAVVAAYLALAVFFSSHFCFGTTLDGIDVGGKDAEGAERLIEEETRQYRLTLKEREDGEESIEGDEIGIRPVFDGEVEELLRGQGAFAWPALAFHGQELSLPRAVEYDEDALEEAVGRLECMSEARQREPVSASVSPYVEGAYAVVPADYGTKVDADALLEAAGEAVSRLDGELDLGEAGCYVEPEVGDDDERLLSLVDDLNRSAQTRITYDFGGEREVLDGERIHEWLSADGFDVAVDEEAVLSFVKELAREHNTAYSPKELATSYGSTVTISGGFYGWRIDNGGEVAQILEDLKAGGEIEREPVYLQTANSHEGNDYGDSYVEINLTAQHLFLYKDGALVLESDFVSGDHSKGRDTPTGAFGVTYKTTDAVLRGEGYETPVSYWMPFNGDVGMHDASWRSSFGGSIYKRNGSHGCINLPPAAAKAIYDAIDQNYAVLVYTLPGTESAAALQQDAADVAARIDAIGTVTAESAAAISDARSRYNALSDRAKAYVSNYETLVAAEQQLALILSGQQPQGQEQQLQGQEGQQGQEQQQQDAVPQGQEGQQQEGQGQQQGQEGQQQGQEGQQQGQDQQPQEGQQQG